RAEDGIRDRNVTGVQTCALPISIAKRKNIGHNISSQYLLSKFGVNFCVTNIIGAHHGRPISENEADICNSFTSSLYQEDNINARSEERRVGKQCRWRWARESEHE